MTDAVALVSRQGRGSALDTVALQRSKLTLLAWRRKNAHPGAWYDVFSWQSTPAMNFASGYRL